MFAYCLNNPVTFEDDTGSAAEVCFGHTTRVPDVPIRQGGGGSTNYNGGNFPQPKSIKTFLDNAQGNVYYNGALVIRFDSSFLSSFAFGNTIFLRNDQISNTTILHEYGHVQQVREYGILKYLSLVFIPSATYNLLSRPFARLHHEYYYNMPWEYDADMRSNIQRAGHKSWAKTARDIYFWLLG